MITCYFLAFSRFVQDLLKGKFNFTTVDYIGSATEINETIK